MMIVENERSDLRQARFFLILQFISDFGDQITAALLAIYLLDITNSTDQVGLVYVFTTAGYVIFIFVGGLLGDRFSRRNILVFSDFLRGAVVLLMIVAVQTKSIGLIYATSFFLFYARITSTAGAAQYLGGECACS